MSNFFDHFTIVSNIVKHISWNDINSFKKLNSLCSEVCEREEIRRCFGILCGFLKSEKNTPKVPKRRKIIPNYLVSQLKIYFRCKKPKLVFIISNNKTKLQLDDIIINQCDSSAIICYVYSKHGIIGSSTINESQHIKYNYSFSSKIPAFSWLCLPKEVEAEILTSDSEINPDTKLVIVLNDSSSKDNYLTSLFSSDDNIENPVHYCGGLVNTIEIFNYGKRCFEKLDNISIGIGGKNFTVDSCVLHEDNRDISVLQQAFSNMKTRNDELIRKEKVKYQCILLFSCFIRRDIKIQSDNSMISEYELFSKYFPAIPFCGMLCEGEIFHVNDGVVKLIKSLHDFDIDGSTSIYLLLTWTE